MFWHCVESGKSKMRVVGVVEARYGHEQKVGGSEFSRSLGIFLSFYV